MMPYWQYDVIRASLDAAHLLPKFALLALNPAAECVRTQLRLQIVSRGAVAFAVAPLPFGHYSRLVAPVASPAELEYPCTRRNGVLSQTPVFRCSWFWEGG